MRHLISMSFALICAGCAHQKNDNPYLLFRSGMPSSEVREAGRTLYEDAFLDYDREMEKEKIDRHYLMVNFEIIPGWIATKPDGALAYFVFERDALKVMSLDYYSLPHAARPYITKAGCDQWFASIRDNIQQAYGKPTRVDNTVDSGGRTTVFTWLSDNHAIRANKFIDELGTDGPRCGSLYVRVFFGPDAEDQKFESELSKFIEALEKDARRKRAVSDNPE